MIRMKDLSKKRGVVPDNYFTVWSPNNAEGIQVVGVRAWLIICPKGFVHTGLSKNTGKTGGPIQKKYKKYKVGWTQHAPESSRRAGVTRKGDQHEGTKRQ